jgi:hypothetical protein
MPGYGLAKSHSRRKDMYATVKSLKTVAKDKAAAVVTSPFHAT